MNRETAYHRALRGRVEGAQETLERMSRVLAIPLVGNPSGDMDLKILKEESSRRFARALAELEHMCRMTVLTRKERTLRAIARRVLRDINTVESIA